MILRAPKKKICPLNKRNSIWMLLRATTVAHSRLATPKEDPLRRKLIDLLPRGERRHVVPLQSVHLTRVRLAEDRQPEEHRPGRRLPTCALLEEEEIQSSS